MWHRPGRCGSGADANLYRHSGRILHLGAEIILVDIDPKNLCDDLDDAERRWTPRCKAIAPVHFGGWPCDIDSCLSFARKRNLRVIQDAAHALPAHRGGQLVGASNSDACVSSFYANKTITTRRRRDDCDTQSRDCLRARAIRSHGFDRDAFDRFNQIGASWSYDVVAPGFKYNLTDLAAAIGIVELEQVYKFQLQRQAIAEFYLDRLEGLPLIYRRLPDKGLHAWHLFPIWIHNEARLNRDEVVALLNEKGVGTSVHYRPLHQMTYWRQQRQMMGAVFPLQIDTSRVRSPCPSIQECNDPRWLKYVLSCGRRWDKRTMAASLKLLMSAAWFHGTRRRSV